MIKRIFSFLSITIFVATILFSFPLETAFAASPVVTITSPSDGGIFDTTSIIVTGTASDPTGIQKVEVSVDGGIFSLATGTTSWSFTTNTLTFGSHTINIRATSNASIVELTAISVGILPNGIAVNPSTNTVYVSNQNSNSVSVINGATNTVTSTVSVGTSPRGIAVNPSTNTVYVANQGNGRVSVINGATNTVTSTISAGSALNGIAVNPSTNTIYVTAGNLISVINGATKTMTAEIPVSGGQFFDIAVNPSTNTIYATDRGTSSVSVINGATNTILSTIPMGDIPGGIAVNPSTNTIYVTLGASVSVINGATNTIVSSIGIGDIPIDIAVNPSTNTVYVSKFGPSISVINGATNTVTSTVSVGTSPLGIAVNPSTNTIYVSNSNSNSVSVIDGGGNMAASSVSFTIIPNSKIVFYSNRDHSASEIYTMNPDGSGIIRLTNNVVTDNGPIWSHDGTKIAFNSNRDGVNVIYIMNADGTGITRLLNTAELSYAPSWSPDDTKIVFAGVRNGAEEINIVNIDGSDEIRLTGPGNESPDWSPDGTKIVFASYRNGNTSPEIYVMNADGTNQTRLTDSSGANFWPRWSPDGTKIVFMSSRTDNYEIYTMNADGTNQTRLTNTSGLNLNPNWSPDGTKIVFASTRDGNYEIYTMNADGTNQTNITNNSKLDLDPDWIGIDTIAPNTSITANPTNPSNLNTASFSFVSTEPGTFECQIDGGSYSACTSPKSYSSLADGSHTFNVRAKDLTGNMDASSATFTWTIDTVAPTITVPASFAIEATNPSGDFVTYSATATDLTDGILIPQCTPISGSTFPIGTTTVTCTATDSSGNTASASFNITVQDTTKPEVSFVSLTPTIVGDSSQLTITKIASDAIGINTVTATIRGPPLSTDIVGTVSLSLNSGTIQSGTWTGTFTFPSKDLIPDGVYAISEDVADTYGNTLSMTDGMITLDRTAPTTSIVSITPNSLRPTDLVTVTAVASDALSGVSSVTAQDYTTDDIPTSLALISGSTDPGQVGTFQGFLNGALPEGLHDVKIITKDNAVTQNENSLIVASAFTVDSTPPTLSMPSDLTLEATSHSGAVVTYGVSATDNIDGSILVICDVPSGVELPLGNTIITCSATDAAGNTSTRSFSVTVVDTTGPSLNLPIDITMEAINAAGAPVSYSATSTDLVDGDIIPICTPSPGSTFSLGSTTVICSATDAAGNTSSGSFTVNVVDTTGPILTLPADITTEATGPSGASVSYIVSASDSVDGNIIPICTPASDSVFSLGSTIVNCLASDSRGNTASGSFSVNVMDTTSPVIQTDITSIGTVTASGAQVTYSATATDLVDGDVPVSCTPVSGSTFQLGSTEVSCSATDSAGNTASSTFFVTITDNNAPTIMVPENIISEATGPSGAPVTYSATAADLVDGDVPVICTPASDSVFTLGSTTVICSATDAAGNTSTRSFSVTVVDTTGPTLNLPVDITAEATSSLGSSVSYSATATDLVDGDVPISCTPASGSTFALGSTTVNCSATDAAGNTSSGSFTVMIVDTTSPTLNLPVDITAEATSSSGAQVTYSTTASDIVDGSLTPICTPASDSTFQLGSTIVSCSVSDVAGHSITGQFTVTVVDTTAPNTSIVSATDGLSTTVTNGGTTSSNTMTFIFTGTDNVGVTDYQCSIDSGTFVSCTSPISYTGLTVGSHTFSVKAIDGVSNNDSTPANFGWSVVSDVTVQQKIQNIIDQVQDLVNKGVLNKGQGNSLIVKLDAAITNLDSGNTVAAKNQLNAFINEANALIKSKGLSTQLQPLVDQAKAIIAQIG